MNQYLPLNPQEHDNDIRTLVVKHMGMGQGNPTQWVVDAVHEAFQRGFSVGLQAGLKMASHPPAPAPAFRVASPALAPASRASEDVIEVLPAPRPARGCSECGYGKVAGCWRCGS